MTENSPKWKNPSDVMKIRTVKRRSLVRRKTIHDPTNISSVLHETNTHSESERTVVLKRKNPFGCNASIKRQNLGNDTSTKTEPKSESRELFKALDCMEENIQNSASLSVSTQNIVSKNDKPLKEVAVVVPAADRDSVVTKTASCAKIHKQLPVDWSVKVKMRILSEASLTWCTQLKMGDEARAVSQHVQGTQKWDGSVDEKKSAFHSCCLHWVHPNIPWIKLFPRIVSEQKISNLSIVGGDEDSMKALHRDWTESFTSVFHLLRSGGCPYFYICTHQFTVLFRALGVNGVPNISACLTPTTRGLREALKAEGISFRMPNLECKKDVVSPGKEAGQSDSEGGEHIKDKGPNNSEAHRNENGTSKSDTMQKAAVAGSTVADAAKAVIDDDEEELIDNDEGASVWLESLGLDKNSFPTLDPKKVKLQREGFRRVDNRPESLVYVEGADVQAIFNYLLNCRSCTATCGPQAGIPPTVLAPVAFKGATLKHNKLKHSVAKQTDAMGNICKNHVIEMSGPILPHHVLNMTHLLQDIQDKKFTLTFNTHEPTSPLNLRSDTVANCDKELDTSGLHPLALLALSGSNILKDNNMYREIVGTKHGFQFEL